MSFARFLFFDSIGSLLYAFCIVFTDYLVPMKRSTKSRIYSLIFTAACVCLSGCKGKSPAEPRSPPLVEVAVVTQADVPIYHDWIGVLEGSVNAHIRAQDTGYLISQNYKEGDP